MGQDFPRSPMWHVPGRRVLAGRDKAALGVEKAKPAHLVQPETQVQAWDVRPWGWLSHRPTSRSGSGGGWVMCNLPPPIHPRDVQRGRRKRDSLGRKEGEENNDTTEHSVNKGLPCTLSQQGPQNICCSQQRCKEKQREVRPPRLAGQWLKPVISAL